MVALVIGLGSMGRRRIRLLNQYDAGLEIIGIDNRADRREQLIRENHIRVYDSLDNAETKDVTIAFVCTAPLAHYQIVRECLNRGWHVFSEINLVDTGYEELQRLAEEKMLTLFLSSTMLYRKEIEYLKEKVAGEGGAHSYTYHVGQYLPDWHPWENYKSFFIGDKRTNGCRELMAIEFPWIIDVFGDVGEIQAVSGKISSLAIDYPDTYQLIFRHKTGSLGMILIDLVSRKAVRNLEVFGESLYISWDGTEKGLKEYDLTCKEEKEVKLYKDARRLPEYNASIIEDAYYSEIECFMETIKGNDHPKYSYAKDSDVLHMIDRIESVADEGGIRDE